MTQEIAEEAGMTVDREGFEAAMKEQQERAQTSVVKGGSMGMQNETLQNITAESHFNYEKKPYLQIWFAIVAADEEVEEVSTGKVHLVFSETPFMLKWGDKWQTMDIFLTLKVNSLPKL